MLRLWENCTCGNQILGRGKIYCSKSIVIKNISPIFFFLLCEAIGTAATPGVLCQPRVIVKMIVENQMDCRLVGETKVLGENLPQRRFCPSQDPT
jgi:hypothetical protein